MSDNEIAVRSIFFLSTLCVLWALEFLTPNHKRVYTRLQRWTTNLGIMVFNSIAMRVLLPLGVYGVASYSYASHQGVLPQSITSTWWGIVGAIIFLDFCIYWQHVLFHKVPLLWRLHKVHHADVDMDMTTAVRFHTAEMVLSLGFKLIIVVYLGLSPVSVICFEIMLNVFPMFNHANIKLPKSLDRWLRWVIVTPDMHRIHHSTKWQEANSNFGFNLSLWDKLFGSYIANPEKGHDHLVIGDPSSKQQRNMSVWDLLIYPFKR